MAKTLKIVLFEYNSKTSLISNFPDKGKLLPYVRKYSQEKLEIIVVKPVSDDEDNYTESKDGVLYYDNIMYKWTDTHPVDNISGNVIFVALAEEDHDTYSVMEDLETQKYNNRYYVGVKYNRLNLDSILSKWSNIKQDDTSGSEESSDEEPRTPRSPRLTSDDSESSDQKSQSHQMYQLYSAKPVPLSLPSEDIEAIFWRMYFLCDYIKVYLQMSFDKIYNIGAMRKLPSLENGYTTPAFFSDDQVKYMIGHSAYFQVEDPILKGFLLSHPVKIVMYKESEFSDKPQVPAVSPLDTGRTLDWMMFNHSQFRRELLFSLMKIVSNFAANNGFLKKEDIPAVVKISVQKSKPKKKSKSPVVSKKKGVNIISSSIRKIREIESDEEEENTGKTETNEKTMNKVYMTSKLWTTIADRIKAAIDLMSSSD